MKNDKYVTKKSTYELAIDSGMVKLQDMPFVTMYTFMTTLEILDKFRKMCEEEFSEELNVSRNKYTSTLHEENNNLRVWLNEENEKNVNLLKALEEMKSKIQKLLDMR